MWACDPVRPEELDAAPDVDFTPDVAPCLADPRVHALVLATPIETHAELALRALRHDKDVLVEKPVATDTRSLEGLLAAARSAGRVLGVNHLLLHHPAIVRMRQEIRAGTVGELLAIVSLRVSQGQRTLECPWWTLAPHDLALIDSLAGALSPRRVELEPLGTDVHATVHAGDVRARIALSLCGARKVRLFVVQGSLGTLVFDDLHRQPLALHAPGPRELPLDERLLRSRLGFGRALDVCGPSPLEGALDAFLGQVRSPARSVARPYAAHMRRVVAALEAGRPFLPGAASELLEVPA